MNIFKVLLVPVLMSMLAGCVIAVDAGDHEDDNWHSRQSKNIDEVNQLALGVTQESVLERLGEPDFSEAFVRNAHEYVVLYYRTRHTEYDGRTTKDETTPLVFNDGVLVGWGDSAVENVAVN